MTDPAASFALASGVPLEVIGRLLGHTDLKTTRRYAHLADPIAKQAAERTAGVVAELLIKTKSDQAMGEMETHGQSNRPRFFEAKTPVILAPQGQSVSNHPDRNCTSRAGQFFLAAPARR